VPGNPELWALQGDLNAEAQWLIAWFIKATASLFSTRIHQFTRRWVAVVIISWTEKGTEKLHSMKDWLKQFETLNEAEDWAIENAKASIDQYGSKHMDLCPAEL
jgi:hypothetical protein